jgi:hypothetical protein
MVEFKLRTYIATLFQSGYPMAILDRSLLSSLRAFLILGMFVICACRIGVPFGLQNGSSDNRLETTIQTTTEPTIEAIPQPTTEPSTEEIPEPTIEPTIETIPEPTIQTTTEPTNQSSLSSTVLIANFSSQTENHTSPQDVLNEVSFFGIGGNSSCRQSFYSQPALELFYSSSPQDWMSSIVILACGWQPDEHVQMTIILPSGQIDIEDYIAKVDEFGMSNFFYAYLPSLSDPQGRYTFIAQGDTSGSTQISVEVTIPSGPRMFWAYQDQGLILYNFQPDEHVRLFRFGQDGKLDAWQEYYTDPNGRLLVKPDAPPDNHTVYYIVLGDQSGEVSISGTKYFDQQASHDPILVVSNAIVAHCSSVLPSRVGIKTRVRAAFTNGQRLRVHTQSGFSSSTITSILEGTTFSIEDGPLCADNTSWWRIRTDNNVVGWVAEEQDGAYLIEPY